jgi:hypothetical protein
MVTDVYPMVAEESSVANHQKLAKIDEKSEKWGKNGLFLIFLHYSGGTIEPYKA